MDFKADVAQMIVVHLHLTAVGFYQRLSPDMDSFVFLSQKQMFMLYKKLWTEAFEVFLFATSSSSPSSSSSSSWHVLMCVMYAGVWVCAHACTWVCRAEKLM